MNKDDIKKLCECKKEVLELKKAINIKRIEPCKDKYYFDDTTTPQEKRYYYNQRYQQRIKRNKFINEIINKFSMLEENEQFECIKSLLDLL